MSSRPDQSLRVSRRTFIALEQTVVDEIVDLSLICGNATLEEVPSA